jgi:hypothetical protein
VQGYDEGHAEGYGAPERSTTAAFQSSIMATDYSAENWEPARLIPVAGIRGPEEQEASGQTGRVDTTR